MCPGAVAVAEESQEKTRRFDREGLAQAAAQARPASRNIGVAILDGIGYARSLLVTVPLVYLSTILWGTLSLLISFFEKSGRVQHFCARWWARTLLALCGVRVTVRGLEHIAPAQTYVFAANHQSYMDIPLLFGYLPGQSPAAEPSALAALALIASGKHRAAGPALEFLIECQGKNAMREDLMKF